MTTTEASAGLEASHKETVDRIAGAYTTIREELGKTIVGQASVAEEVLTAIFARGHCLLEGVPGLAKTLLISTLARCMHLTFRRVQFTPDLMPSDIIGTEVLQDDPETGERRFKFLKGPVFTHILLADEINRTPPKTQAALLQAMQEYHVTVAGEHHPLSLPFFVMGTQNPIESEGTYPLPEAQLDRFMLKVSVDYPSLDQEIDIAMTTTGTLRQELEPVLSREQILSIQQVVRRVLVAWAVASYAVRLVRATRPNEASNPGFVRKYVSWGAGPRACQALLLGSKARALLDGRTNVSIEDIQYMAKPVLRHRIVTNFTAESENIAADDLVEKLVEELPEAV